MAIQKIFKSTVPTLRFYCKDGFPVVFMLGRFTTDNKKVEAELMEEVGEIGRHKSKHTFIFVDENESEVDTEALSPAEQLKLQLKEEARREVLAELAESQARAMNVTQNVSSSNSDHAASVATTATIAAASSESTGKDKPATAAPATNVLAAKLANLNVGKS